MAEPRKGETDSVLKHELDDGYCDFVADAPDRHLEVSEDTVRKVAATQEYLRQYYTELISYLNHRQRRYQNFKQKLQRHNYSDEVRQKHARRYFRKESNYLRRKRSRMTIKDFHLLALLGKGGYGEVYLTRHRKTQEILALKKMKKSRFVAKNEVHRVKQERNIMVKTNSEWLTQLKYSFQDKANVYLAMEYIAGGDIKHLLDHVGCLPEDAAKFFLTEMFLAVNTLHKLGYIHRDLKPDNFMVDASGHLKLIDFGLSKQGMASSFYNSASFKTFSSRRKSDTLGSTTKRGPRRKSRAYSMVGSPEYMAIEILDGEGYSSVVDYWSLGVIFYEMLFGITPFIADTIIDVFSNIVNYNKSLVRDLHEKYGDAEGADIQISDEAWDLLTKLICSSDTRIGATNGFKDVQNHPFFADIEWEEVRNLEPPFIPELESDIDTSYFVNDDMDSGELGNLDELLEDDSEPGAYLGQFSARTDLKEGGTTEGGDAYVLKYAFAGFSFRHYATLKKSGEVKKTAE
mmetsp:Transcript_27355/g.30466  ORF Transcript_27355/g.30466 Transcript_27355/m.30466 type:complete len:516 (-) Transcript_27355:30-1577(-)